MISAIILAAGLSSRMGSKNKMLMNLGKKSIIETTVHQILQSRASEIIVITGMDSRKVAKVLQEKPIRVIFNPNYEKGITTSIQCGVRACSPETDGYLIHLGDMPFVQSHEINRLILTFEKHKASSPIIVPFYQNKKGNPVIFSSFYKKQILAHKELDGCRGILREYNSYIIPVNMESDHVLKDIDNPNDFEQLTKE